MNFLRDIGNLRKIKFIPLRYHKVIEGDFQYNFLVLHQGFFHIQTGFTNRSLIPISDSTIEQFNILDLNIVTKDKNGAGRILNGYKKIRTSWHLIYSLYKDCDVDFKNRVLFIVLKFKDGKESLITIERKNLKIFNKGMGIQCGLSKWADFY